MKILLCFLSVFFIVYQGNSQEILDLKRALQLLLENNFDIKMVQKDKEIALINNSYSNAGFLPKLILNGTETFNRNDTKQQFFDGRVREADDAKSNALSSSLLMNWTIFDGFEMYLLKSELQYKYQQTDLLLQSKIEYKIAELMSIYFGIVLQMKKKSVYQQALNYSKERVKLAEKKYQIGSASGLSTLQAVVDMNVDSANLMNQKLIFENELLKLNSILGVDIKTQYYLSDTIRIQQTFSSTDVLLKVIEKNNKELLISQNNIAMSLISYRLVHVPNYPRLELFGGYSFAKSKSEVGLLQSSKNTGMVYGVNFSYTIFNGFDTKRNAQIAVIEHDKLEIERQNIINELTYKILSLYNNYSNGLNLLQLQQKNIEFSKQNLTVAFERYKLGDMSEIDLREIQLKYMQAENSYLDMLYQIKNIEIELNRICGKLNVD